MIVGLIIGAVFYRGSATGDGPGTTEPSAGPITTTPGGEGSTTTTSGGEGSTTVPGPVLPELEGVTLELVYEGFRQPVGITAPPGDDRLFVTQRIGVIRILDENRELVDPAFLDITDRVLAGGIEQGLLGLAFHPDYANNGRFFVYYTTSQARRLSEFTVLATNSDRALGDSEQILLEVPHPANAAEPRHYAGNLLFGPDGYLWASSGDGADSRAQGQNPETIFGTVLRIDVDSGDPYAIPPDNPFASEGGAAEVWAYGLRNPWRFSFDPVERLVYIGDVGHNTREEINIVPFDQGGGYNFGWSDMEGDRCFHLTDCNPDDYTSPALVYRHRNAQGEIVTDRGSVTGGFVYRGSEIPELHGTYFYSDWVAQWIKSFRYVDGQVTEERDWTEDLGGPVGGVTSFGLDGHGELHLVTFEGRVYKLIALR